MAKGGKRGRRMERDSPEQEEQSNDAKDDLQNDMDFAQRRELQRKVSAEKRRAKLKCRLCGEKWAMCGGIVRGLPMEEAERQNLQRKRVILALFY
jgi:hypothetical protein